MTYSEKKVFQDEGIILHTTPFKEHDCIASLFTSQHGLLSVIAKGAHRPKSLLRPIVIPLSQAECLLSKGQGNLYRLIEIRSVQKQVSLRQNLQTLNSACELCQCIRHSQLPEKPTPALHLCFKKYLAAVSSINHKQTLNTSFRLKILLYEGALSIQQECSTCQAPLKKLYLCQGQSFCHSHASYDPLIFDASESLIIYALTHLKALAPMQDIKVNDLLYKKVKLLFNSHFQNSFSRTV